MISKGTAFGFSSKKKEQEKTYPETQAENAVYLSDRMKAEHLRLVKKELELENKRLQEAKIALQQGIAEEQYLKALESEEEKKGLDKQEALLETEKKELFQINNSAIYFKPKEIPDSCEEQESPSSPISFTHEIIPDLQPVKTHLEKLIQEGYHPEELLVISDVDGVLTNYSNPKTIVAELQPRTGVKELLNYVKKKNIPFLASSAWNKSSDTLEKLQMLEETLQLNQFLTQGCKKFQTHKNQDHEITQCGRAVNVKDRYTIGDPFYHKKAFSALYGLSLEAQKKIKRVIFIDNSALDNSLHFSSDYPSLQEEYPVNFPHLSQNYDFFQPTTIEGKPSSVRVSPKITAEVAIEVSLESLAKNFYTLKAAKNDQKNMKGLRNLDHIDIGFSWHNGGKEKTVTESKQHRLTYPNADQIVWDLDGRPTGKDKNGKRIFYKENILDLGLKKISNKTSFSFLISNLKTQSHHAMLDHNIQVGEYGMYSYEWGKGECPPVLKNNKGSPLKKIRVVPRGRIGEPNRHNADGSEDASVNPKDLQNAEIYIYSLLVYQFYEDKTSTECEIFHEKFLEREQRVNSLR